MKFKIAKEFDCYSSKVNKKAEISDLKFRLFERLAAPPELTPIRLTHGEAGTPTKKPVVEANQTIQAIRPTMRLSSAGAGVLRRGRIGSQ
jgi:hypothetical protein